MTRENLRLAIEPFRQSVEGARVTVVGGARSGVAVAGLLAKRGAEVFLTDYSADPGRLGAELEAVGVASEFGGHTDRAMEADLLVLSPGVPSTAPLVVSAIEAGLPVVGEIEVASWFCRGPIVAVTGSNGKTTTTTLIAHVFETAGLKHVVAGNIGTAFSDHIDAIDADTHVVLEVSSFQLDHISTFRPHVAVLLNVTPDHLDRYGGDFERYAAAKYRLFENQTEADWLVYNLDDPHVRQHVERAASSRGLAPVPFSIEATPEPGAFVRGSGGTETITLSLPHRDPTTEGPLTPTDPVFRDDDFMSTSDLALRGRHNLYNSLAAAIVARAVEIRSDVVRQSLTSFEGVPHRLERVRSVRGVEYVNDSKATNVNAVWYALESFATREDGAPAVVLIAGGRDKGNDYGPLRRLVTDKVKGIVAIGEGADAVLDDLGGLVEHTAHASSMAEAVQYAGLIAEAGDTVLLSPACASFDMFDNYEHRGDAFKDIVRSL
ncbi:MAG: UDP-N-acetylmuramoyl-L-alanine--D-glutamate ligase [Bacteroidota bacterium]